VLLKAMAHTCPDHPQETSAANGAATELLVSGMNCGNCVQKVSRALQSVPDVANAVVVLDQGRATVRWKPGASRDTSALVKAVEAAGFEAKPLAAKDKKIKRAKWSPLAGWQFNVVVGLICTVPLIIGEWIFQLGMEKWFQWLAFALALPVQILCGAWTQAKQGSSSMDTLVALGSTTAFGYSTWAFFSGAGGHLYFMEAAAIITLISLGHWFEARASSRAETSLRALLHLAPQRARRRNPDGTESEIAVSELQIGNVISLRPGDRIPTDGEVIEGQSAVEESMLTGESIPVDKEPGNKLYAGTVNLNGHILMRVTATGESTALAHIIAAVERAQNSRAQIQRLADQVSSVFVPIVITIALATGLWWGLAPEQAHWVSEFLGRYLWPAHIPTTTLAAAVISVAAVLIVACPCAMGLATPIAIMAGTNAAAHRGILIRDGIALERAGQITAVMFDKTGTLTRGKPAVVDSQIFSERGEKSDYELTLAAALARRSNHPLSQTVAKLFPNEFPFTAWQEIRGAGVQAQLEASPGSTESRPTVLRLGSLNWLKNSGVDGNCGAPFAEKWMNQGATLLGLAIDQKLVALIALRDTLKLGAAEVVQQIVRKQLKVFLITGDNQRTAKAIAEQAGIPPENVFAEIRPEQKAELVKQLQQRGERVAFVGDGINDAPALEQADLGIAVSKASDVASEAADIILLNSEIHAIPEAIGLARATLRTIKQNLFWAFFYNAAAIPLAALGFLSPVLCAAAMGMSDLVVIGNALRLRRWKSEG
jgi:Cu+-exporting ATPase